LNILKKNTFFTLLILALTMFSYALGLHTLPFQQRPRNNSVESSTQDFFDPDGDSFYDL
jgi:hypothetical protein